MEEIREDSALIPTWSSVNGAPEDFLPLNLTLEGVSYSLEETKKRARRTLLHGIDCSVQAGQLLAIMGSTGAGKTTLLDVMAGRKTIGQIQGTILMNGESIRRKFQRISAYVTQDDCFMGTLTVRETLRFNANLRLPSTYSRQTKSGKVEQLIQDLRLSPVSESYIGSQFRRGISGGEKKRVAIACELITDPRLVFLDEPTTGLDSYNALLVMQLLLQLAKGKNLAIVSTIHQPRSSIFELFDQLMLLDDGYVVYFGAASQSLSYFANLGYECPRGYNPADFFVDVTLSGARSDVEKEKFVNAYRESETRRQALSVIQELKHSKDYPKISQLRFPKYATSFWTQFFELSKRNAKNLVRNPMTSQAQLGQVLFMALLLGSLYFGISRSQNSIQDRLGILFFIITNQAFGNISLLRLFLEERLIFNRERAAGVYTSVSYFLGKLVTELPVVIIFPTLFSTIIYWMVHLQPDLVHFAIYLLFVVLTTACASSLLSTIGAISPNEAVANVLAPVSIVLMLLFGGFFQNKKSIPIYYSWFQYLSIFKYSYQALLKNELEGLHFTCTKSEETPDGHCPIDSGHKQLEIMGLENVDIWENALILVSMFFAFRVITLFALQFLHKEKR